MHCPKCGAPAAEHQKFCRACGFSLEKVAQLLGESSSLVCDNPSSGEKPDSKHDRLNRMDQLWHIGLGVLGGGFVLAVCWAIISEVIIKKGHLISGSLFLAFIIGLVTLGLSGLYIEMQRKKLAERQKSSSLSDPLLPETSNADTTNKLLPEADHVSKEVIIA